MKAFVLYDELLSCVENIGLTLEPNVCVKFSSEDNFP
jgi:hypothetical protein